MTVPELIVSLDFGASLIKGVYTLGKGFDPKLFILSPHLVPIPPLTDLEPFTGEELQPEESAWVECKGKRFALGSLAKNRFKAPVLLELPKIETIIPRTLAAIGCIAATEGLQEFSLSLWILIPSNEYKDGMNISEKMQQSLLEFTFRSSLLKVSLTNFSCKPEGAGIFVRVIRQGNFKSKKAAVLMLGYRNATILSFKEGMILHRITENYGFVSIVESLNSLALIPSDLEEVVGKIFSSGGDKLDKKVLKTLIRLDEDDKKNNSQKIATIELAIQKAREEYFTLLKYWLTGKLLEKPQLIIVVGGTSHYPYLKKQLTQLFNKNQIKAEWGEEIADKIGFMFADKIEKDPSLKYRLLDVYCLFLEQDSNQRKVKL